MLRILNQGKLDEGAIQEQDSSRGPWPHILDHRQVGFYEQNTNHEFRNQKTISKIRYKGNLQFLCSALVSRVWKSLQLFDPLCKVCNPSNDRQFFRNRVATPVLRNQPWEVKSSISWYSIAHLDGYKPINNYLQLKCIWLTWLVKKGNVQSS